MWFSLSFGDPYPFVCRPLKICSISSNGKSFFQFDGERLAVQRNAPIRTHKPSTGWIVAKPKILLVSA